MCQLIIYDVKTYYLSSTKRLKRKSKNVLRNEIKINTNKYLIYSQFKKKNNNTQNKN